jgi:Ca2+-transporting ATPase
MVAIAGVAGVIPEGFALVMTATLAIGVARMAKKNAAIRKPSAVETLGCTTVICSDKTGTLTRGEMTVKLVYDGNHVFEVTGIGYEPHGQILREWLPIETETEPGVIAALRIGLLCNESRIAIRHGEYRVFGDPTEAALVVAATKAGLNPDQERQDYPLVDVIPFETERGYMATLHRHNGRKFIFVKGIPEKLLDTCADCMAGTRAGFLRRAEGFAAEGLRVLAMAYKEAAADLEQLGHPDMESGLVCAGLQAMVDPPRPEAIEAVEGCRKAGIRVVMVTGDHAATAAAIAKEFDIAGPANESGVITGKDLEVMSDEDLFVNVKRFSIFARVSPYHKLRLIRQLFQHGDIVTATGDGVNDASALKAAHIGVAMGKTGTNIAKEAADMIITDDNFASIFHAVQEGRVVFDNIRKIVFFLIPSGSTWFQTPSSLCPWLSNQEKEMSLPGLPETPRKASYPRFWRRRLSLSA